MGTATGDEGNSFHYYQISLQFKYSIIVWTYNVVRDCDDNSIKRLNFQMLCNQWYCVLHWVLLTDTDDSLFVIQQTACFYELIFFGKKKKKTKILRGDVFAKLYSPVCIFKFCHEIYT